MCARLSVYKRCSINVIFYCYYYHYHYLFIETSFQHLSFMGVLGFNPQMGWIGSHLCGVYMFAPRLHGFTLTAPVSSYSLKIFKRGDLEMQNRPGPFDMWTLRPDENFSVFVVNVTKSVKRDQWNKSTKHTSCTTIYFLLPVVRHYD